MLSVAGGFVAIGRVLVEQQQRLAGRRLQRAAEHMHFRCRQLLDPCLESFCKAEKGERTSSALIAAAHLQSCPQTSADKYAESAVPAGGWSEQGTPPPTTALQPTALLALLYSLWRRRPPDQQEAPARCRVRGQREVGMRPKAR